MFKIRIELCLYILKSNYFYSYHKMILMSNCINRNILVYFNDCHFIFFHFNITIVCEDYDIIPIMHTNILLE